MKAAWHLAAGPRSPWKVRYFLDTEFTDFSAFELVSLALVGEDGREFYAERSDIDSDLCSAFVRKVVIPKLGTLPGRTMPLTQMRRELQAWLATVPLKPTPVLCYDFEGDLTLVEQLLGSSLPRGWKIEDIEQRLDGSLRTAYLQDHGIAHHALHDARANAIAFR